MGINLGWTVTDPLGLVAWMKAHLKEHEYSVTYYKENDIKSLSWEHGRVPANVMEIYAIRED